MRQFSKKNPGRTVQAIPARCSGELLTEIHRDISDEVPIYEFTTESLEKLSTEL